MCQEFPNVLLGFDLHTNPNCRSAPVERVLLEAPRIPKWIRLTLGAVPSRFRGDTRVKFGSVCFRSWYKDPVDRVFCTRSASFRNFTWCTAVSLVVGGWSLAAKGRAIGAGRAGADEALQELRESEMAASTCFL